MLRFVLITIALLTIAVQAAGQFTHEQIHTAIQQAGGPERFLSAMATNTAKMSGQMFDDQTQLTGAAAYELSLIYYVRLVNYEKNEIPNIPVFRQKVASTLAPSICTAPVSSLLINEYGAKYNYMVYSKSREYLFEYSYNRATCAPTYRW